ncbi:MAG: site-specific integrase [Sphaerisporangium sp.]|nr:site-specific integrase [Sphaerisporangium sp.]
MDANGHSRACGGGDGLLGSINKDAKRWLAVWIGPDGREKTRAFAKKVDADRYGAAQEVDASRGTYIDPRSARLTLSEWCETWLTGYATRRASSVRQAKVHIAQITAHLGEMQLSALRRSHVRSWTSRLREAGLADSYVYALHGRLSQIMSDAVHDGIIPRSPCSRRTSPGQGSQRPYVATTDQVWALHDAMPERYRAAILLGAFVGLRMAEVCGLRVADVDFMRGIVHPTVQYPAEALKTETSRMPVPIPTSLALELSAHVQAGHSRETLLTDDDGAQVGPWKLERAMRKARGKVQDLPTGFRFHDLRHYLASLLIASGADVKVVQARLRHASAKTTLDTYGHLWPDSDESTRAAINAVLVARTEQRQNQTGAAR